MPVDAFIPSDWSLDDIPGEWIIEVDDNFIDFDVIGGSLHQFLDVIWRLWHFLLIDYLLVELIDGESLNKVDGECKSEVIFDFSMRDLLFG